MENASKALIIAGAILISILIIAIGMYIYSSSTKSIQDATGGMDTQQIQAFNAQWTAYEGTQSGTQVKTLLSQIMANANTNKELAGKVLEVTCQTNTNTQNNISNVKYNGSGNLDSYIGNINGAYAGIQSRHNYTVVTRVDPSTSLVHYIEVKY